MKPRWGFGSLRLGRGWEERWATVAPRFLGIFPASFGALTPPWPAPGERLELKEARPPPDPSHLTTTLTSCPPPKSESGQDGPVSTLGGCKICCEGRVRGWTGGRDDSRKSDVRLEWLAAGGKRGLWKRRQDQSRVCVGGGRRG